MQGERDKLDESQKNTVQILIRRHTLRISVVLRKLKCFSQRLLRFVGEFHIVVEVAWRSTGIDSRFI